MTMRGVLVWYLGSVIVVGATGASAYQVLLRRHATTEAAATKPVVVAEAPVQAVIPPAPAPVTPPTPTPAEAAPSVSSLPKLRPPVAAAEKPTTRERTAAISVLSTLRTFSETAKPTMRHRTVAEAHRPVRRPTMMASVHREPPVYQPRPYGPPPSSYYAYPAYYPYGGYYAYYPPYGYYYRSF